MRGSWTVGLFLGMFAAGAAAGPENVQWPAAYKDTYTYYYEGDRLTTEKQSIRIYANPVALEGAESDGKLPYGSVLVAELYSVKLDGDGNPIESALGRRVIDKLAAIAVMERGEGFDAEYGEDLKVGDWEFAVFSPAGERLDKAVTACRECHHPLTNTEFVWSYDHLTR
ncbi:MAG: cytochrome P460 family protein [Pseudomonadota bacterium]